MNASEYLKGHLEHFVMKLGKSSFWQLHFDTIIVSIIVAVGINFCILRILKHSSWDKVTTAQQGLEMYYTWIEEKVLSNYKQLNLFLISMGFAMFLWILGMNLCDLLPTSLFSFIAQAANLSFHFNIVPTEDLNTALALGTFVFIVTNIYYIINKGVLPFIKYLLCEPFGFVLFPINLLFHLIEQVSRPFSLMLRLFGNMFSGGIIFAVLGLAPFWLQPFLIMAWSGLHAPVILIQALLFTDLTMSYIPPAKELGLPDATTKAG